MKVILLCLALGLASLRADDVVVSIRYLQITGKSHAALFLFDGQGKLVRQLTKPGADQDYAPVFSPDGKEIAFRRVKDETSPPRWMIVDRAGKNTRPLDGPPAWYADRTMAQEFADADSFSGPDDQDTDPARDRTFSAPDGSLSIVLKPNPDDEDHPLAFLREKDGPLQPFAQMPGFTLFWMLHLQKKSPFLITPKLRVAFYGGEHDSTLGTTTYALHVEKKTIVTLSENGASAYPAPGQNGFWVLASSRYEPLGDGKRTVNCSYLDWYDASMKRTRFGRNLGKYGGASVYTPGKGALTFPNFIFED